MTPKRHKMGTKSKISAVKKRIVTEEDKICEIISRGGKTTLESRSEEDQEVRFTVRIPSSWVKRIDVDRKSRVGTVSRNQWILESIAHFIDEV
jgi:hypothetical protein